MSSTQQQTANTLAAPAAPAPAAGPAATVHNVTIKKHQNDERLYSVEGKTVNIDSAVDNISFNLNSKLVKIQFSDIKHIETVSNFLLKPALKITLTNGVCYTFVCKDVDTILTLLEAKSLQEETYNGLKIQKDSASAELSVHVNKISPNKDIIGFDIKKDSEKFFKEDYAYSINSVQYDGNTNLTIDIEQTNESETKQTVQVVIKGDPKPINKIYEYINANNKETIILNGHLNNIHRVATRIEKIRTVLKYIDSDSTIQLVRINKNNNKRNGFSFLKGKGGRRINTTKRRSSRGNSPSNKRSHKNRASTKRLMKYKSRRRPATKTGCTSRKSR